MLRQCERRINLIEVGRLHISLRTLPLFLSQNERWMCGVISMQERFSIAKISVGPSVRSCSRHDWYRVGHSTPPGNRSDAKSCRTGATEPFLALRKTPRPYWQKERVPVARVPQTLRQVVAERGHEHVVDSVWRNVGTRARRRDRARPCVSDQVGILRTELQSSLGTVVQAQPEPERALDSALGIAAAVTERSGNRNRCPTRVRFRFSILSQLGKGQDFEHTGHMLLFPYGRFHREREPG